MEVFSDYSERVEAFKDCMIPASSVLIATHDYPDPDCLASAAGVHQLLTFWGIESVTISYGGFVGRAENRAMMRVMELVAAPMMLVDLDQFDKVVLVDAKPGAGNVSLPETQHVDAVIDHHMAHEPSPTGCYCDVRQDIGATSTMVTQYLRIAGCPISPNLATALYYGIKTDTGDMGREAFAEDLICCKHLFDIMDFRLLWKIEHPERTREFYETLHRASSSIRSCGPVGFMYLEEVRTPDYVAQMADFFCPLDTLDVAVCAGVFSDALFFSIRAKSAMQVGRQAEKIARRCKGSGGGHGKIGAGKIPIGKRNLAGVLEKFWSTVKEAFGVTGESENMLFTHQAR